jgi:predicted TIM-barrel fold metal-dependent hydrolase
MGHHNTYGLAHPRKAMGFLFRPIRILMRPGGHPSSRRASQPDMSFLDLDSMERREFLKDISPLLWSAAALTQGNAAASSAVSSKPAWRRRGWIPVFDAHLHIPSNDGRQHWQVNPVTATGERFMSYLDQCGVERGVINSVRSQLATSAEEMIAGNREVLRYADRYPGRLVPACIIMPQYVEESLREIEDWKNKYGCVWIGELCNYVSGYKYDTPAFARIMQRIRELKMVVQIHATNDEMSMIVERYPETTIVFAHLGTGDRLKQRVALVAVHAKCYLEISAGGHDYLGGVEYAVREIGADRVLFGSDFSINDPSGVISVVDDALLPSSVKEKMFHKNVESILSRAGYSLDRGRG